MLPNLFIPGAGKSGSSTLHQLLNQHPKIFMSPIKEPQFFSHDEGHWGNCGYNNDIDAYEKLFDGAVKKSFRYVGESSTSYLFFPNVIERIKSHYGVENYPKFILIFRNPINRVWSHYVWQKSYQSESHGFDKAFNESRDYLVQWDKHHTDNRGYYYYQNGFSGMYLQRFIEEFGSDRIHCVIFERLVTDPLNELNKVFDWLGLDALHSIETCHSNKTTFRKYSYIFKIAQKISSSFLVRRLNKTPFIHYIFSSIYKFASQASQKKKPIMGVNEKKLIIETYSKDVSLLRNILDDTIPEWNEFPRV